MEGMKNSHSFILLIHMNLYSKKMKQRCQHLCTHMHEDQLKHLKMKWMNLEAQIAVHSPNILEYSGACTMTRRKWS